MRLAFISDIHGNLPALEAILADIATREVDATYHLGDLVGSASTCGRSAATSPARRSSWSTAQPR